MENEQILWVIGIILLALVVAYALSKGYNVTLRRKNTEASFQKNAENRPGTTIEVAKRSKITEAKTGDISGIKMSGAGGPPPGNSDSSISVLEKAEIKEAEVGDISGVKHVKEKDS